MWNATTLRTAVLKVEPNPFGGFDLRQSDGKLVLVPFVVEPHRFTEAAPGSAAR